MGRFTELLRSLNNLKLLAAVGRSGGDLTSIADLVDNMIDSPQMAACIQRFRAQPGGAAMLDTEARWLTQRIATTHDIHHVVSGFNTNPDGEIGVLAITALQIGFPAYVLLTTAAQLAGFRFQLERYEALSRSFAHGAAIAHSAQCLAAVPWEEGWEKPVVEWRRELGIELPAD